VHAPRHVGKGAVDLGVVDLGSRLIGALRAALDGVGIAHVPACMIEDWTPRSVGFYLYYPSRRQMPAALQAFIDMVKAPARAAGP
jgi:DNA-binding transcriptional LysR family regulator